VIVLLAPPRGRWPDDGGASSFAVPIDLSSAAITLAGRLDGRSAHLLYRRLLDWLSRGVDTTPVTLLSGPAGSGKTVRRASAVVNDLAGRLGGTRVAG
jgi:hypothetical protein